MSYIYTNTNIYCKDREQSDKEKDAYSADLATSATVQNDERARSPCCQLPDQVEGHTVYQTDCSR